ncbi:MAG TPA: DUF5103 domain-containing protein [Methanocorpusculum sp.]|nr:DUF5103 domain-containing protein [Methanocorpusculum sp.]
MKSSSIIFFLLLAVQNVVAQQQSVLGDNIRTLQVTVDNDPLQPVVMRLGGRQHVCIDFDELSHDYHRYQYHVEHCTADWNASSQLFESDYLSGFNDQPIEDYENSFNTNQIYTHYRLQLPNEQTSMLLSGNYRVLIYDSDAPDDTVAVAEFCVLEPLMSISATVSSNTDIDFNGKHQQVSYSLSYGMATVLDPMREIYMVVMQNRRMDNAIRGLQPNIRKSSGAEWTYQRELIFPAGSEYHKFELVNVHRPGMNVDNIRWYDPWYHVTLFADTPTRNYSYDEDQNGVCVIRGDEEDDGMTTGEYLLVHFILQCSEPLPGGDVYVNGLWSGNFPNPMMKMEWNDTLRQYECVAMLKQGYYSYQYLQADESGHGHQCNIDGDWYQTENEYIILAYYREQGARYDRLTAYSKFNSNVSD